jgi:hypothetical protein
MKPGAKTISASAADPNFAPSTGSRAITITKEDARVAYTGPANVSLAANPGGVVLTASVKDIAAAIGDTVKDATPGDIRNATVSFVDRSTNAIIATVNVTASDSEPKVGVATYTWPVNIGTAASKSFTIGFTVSGYYNRSNTVDNAVVVVSK